MKRIDLSIILACYNEGPTLEKSVLEILKVLETTKKNWEIIFVEDKSSDETTQKVKDLARDIKNAKTIFHRQNQGRGKTVVDGISAARGVICGYLDVDLEVSADYIPIFVEEIEKGTDMVIGQRFYEGGLESLSRFLASKIYSVIAKILLALPIDDTEAGYKFFRRSKISPIVANIKDKGWFFDTEICARAYWAGLKITQVPVLFIRRTDKKSTVRLLPDSWAYLTKIIKFKAEVPKAFQNH